MPRLIRNTVILAKIETTYGIDASPNGATDALLISDASFEYDYKNVDRNLRRPYLGGAEQLAGTRFVKASFSVEISGAGAAGTAPAWGKLLRACAMAEVVTAATRVDYTPISSGFESLTICYHLDGLLHTLLGCMGTVELAMGEGERPLYKFSFTGIDGGATEASNPSTTLTMWKAPTVITDSNSGDIKLGGAYAAGAITGGTAYPSRGLSLNLGNSVQQMALLGGQKVAITERAVTSSLQLELSAAQEAAFITDINANTLTSLSFEHGTTAGYKVLLFAPSVQRTNPKHADYQGNAHLSMDLRLTPSSGNDELRIVAL